MNGFFIASASLGIIVLLLQVIFSLFGVGDLHGMDGLHTGESTIGEGLELLTVRSIAAGVGFFGLAGLGSGAMGAPALLAVLAGGVAGVGAMVSTAFLMRQVMRLESDGSLCLDGAVGLAATVYLTIPPGRTGPGKVHFVRQGRTVEMGAVTPVAESLVTGASVMVVSVVDPDTVEVIPDSLIDEVLR
ncbi:MAG: hypothetical protein LBG44_03210 [Gemmatimonadota bacterium]|jgi:hypothetical protein|nr:hypothetical protein [Gemmatimonadota bacterium]